MPSRLFSFYGTGRSKKLFNFNLVFAQKHYLVHIITITILFRYVCPGIVQRFYNIIVTFSS